MSWWTDLYDDDLAAWMLHRATPEEGERTARFLQHRGVLPPGARVFDQGCGPGRLIAPLRQVGAIVEGIDLVPSYIEQARSRAVAVGLDPAGFRVGDIACDTSQEPVDLVISWWTCLGYADDDAANALPLARALESLCPGGAYAIDTLHTPGVLRGFLPETRSETPTPDGPLRLHRLSRLDVENGVLHKRWTWTLPGGRTREIHTRLRLYMPHEWRRMLEAAGFADVRAFGDLDAQPLGPDSPRLILLARRPL